MAEKVNDDLFEDVPYGSTEDIDDALFEDVPFGEESEDGPSKVDTMLQHGTQGMAFGFGDELAGGFEAAGRAVGLEGVGGPITDIGIAGDEWSPTLDKKKLLQSYREGRDKQRSRLTETEMAHPKTALAADVAGSMVVPGGLLKTAGKVPGLAKAATKIDKMGKVGKGIAAGAGVGGVEAAGRSDADLTKGEVGEFAEDVAIGTTIGGVTGGLMGKVGQKLETRNLKKAAQKAEDEANILAMESVGAGKKHFSKEFGEKLSKRSGVEKAKGTGITLKEEGLIKYKQDPIEFNSAVNNKLDDVFDNRIIPVTKKLDDLTGNLSEEVIQKETADLNNKLLNRVEELEDISGLNPAGSESLIKKARASIENLMEELQTPTTVGFDPQVGVKTTGPGTITKILETKRKIAKMLNETDWTKAETTGTKDYLKGVVTDLNAHAQSLSKKVSTNLAEELATHNKTYGNLSSAKEIAIEQLSKDAAKAGFTLGDYIAMGIGGSVGGPVGAAVAMGGKKAIEKGTGKSIPQLIKTKQALSKFKKVKRLTEKSQKPESIFSRKSTEIAGGAAGGVSATLDKNDMKQYKLQKHAAKMAEKATPEMLTQQAQDLRNEHGEEGEKLATILDKMSQKDKGGRRALMFHILQNPHHRKMLGVSK